MTPKPLRTATKTTPPAATFPVVSAVFTRVADSGVVCYNHFYGSCELRSSSLSYERNPRWRSTTTGAPGGGFFPAASPLPIEDFFEDFSFANVAFDVIVMNYADQAAYVWFSMTPTDVNPQDPPDIRQEDFFGPHGTVTQTDFFS